MTENLLKKDLGSFLNPEEKFVKEKKAGQWIFGIAVSVEVLAASIGLFIAWIMAYSSYYDMPIEEQNTGAVINAMIGALPFLVIAVIEPTKIPLAYGLYKVKLIGWKILFFIALVCLTIVTFETMFTSLERQLTNVTIKVVRTQNQLNVIDGRILEIERLKSIAESKTPDNITNKFSLTLNDLYKQKKDELDGMQIQHNNKIEPLKFKIDDLKETNKVFSKGSSEVNNQSLKVLSDRKKQLIKDIENIRKDRNREVQEYKAEINNQIKLLINRNSNTDKNLNQKTEKEEGNIKNLREKQILENEKLLKSLEQIGARLTKIKLNLNAQRNIELSKVPTGLFSGEVAAKKVINKKYDLLLSQEEINFNQQKDQATINNKKINNDLNKEINLKQNKIDDLNNKIVSKIGNSLLLPKIEQSKIENIKNKFIRKEQNKQKNIEDSDKEISRIMNESSGIANQERKKIQAKIDKLNDQILRIENQFQIDFKVKQKFYEDLIIKNENQKDKELKSVFKAQDSKEEIEKNLSKLKSQKQDTLEIIRNEAQRNQIYRFAASWNNLDDVALVTKKQLKWISIIWFGSIAFIVSTMGTVLALISVILQDPDAFVNKPKLKIRRLLGKIFLFLALRFNKLIGSLIKLILAIAKLLLSFTEIFRGFIGKPLQRSIRKFLLSYRKRLIKPKIIIEKKEVTKEVQVEVIKKIEVEVIKEVIKEVPVDKLVIQKVPVEITRKEIRYIPIYSGDTALTEAQTNNSISTKNTNSTLLTDKDDDIDEERFLRQKLENTKHELGDEDTETLMTKHNLAVLLKGKSEYEEAEALYREVLEAEERLFPAEDSDTLTTKSNLASLLKDKGEINAAEALYREMLEVMERLLAPEHYSTLICKTNIAELLKNKGEHNEAEKFYRQVLEVRERLLGPEHPDTLVIKDNLSKLLKEKEELKNNSKKTTNKET
ncbi:tetratricopeptide repeat protein [Alphaproteobacteria bacterium]|nr:tetratricopeptide repeat protein [Alphaproteobacteria bacterium]